MAEHVRRPTTAHSGESGAPTYRFDPPQTTQRIHTTPATQPTEVVAGARASGTSGATATRSSRDTIHRSFDRLDQPVNRSRVAGRSPILPNSDPFAIPANSLSSTLAPAIHFAMLVVLFTTAGTSILVMRNSHARPAEANKAKPNVVVKHATITPAVIVPGATKPTATGPLGSASRFKRRTATRSAETGDPRPVPYSVTTADGGHDEKSSSVIPSDEIDKPTSDDWTGAETGCVYPGTCFPSAELSENGRLPRVRMAEDAPAIARFSGTVTEAQPHQAQHDDEQSLH